MPINTGAVVTNVYHALLAHWGRDKMAAIFQTAFFKFIFNAWISIENSLKFVRKGPINNIPLGPSSDHRHTWSHNWTRVRQVFTGRPQCPPISRWKSYLIGSGDFSGRRASRVVVGLAESCCRDILYTRLQDYSGVWRVHRQHCYRSPCQTPGDFLNPWAARIRRSAPIRYWSYPEIVNDWCIYIITLANISRMITRTCLRGANMLVPSLYGYVNEHQVCGRISAWMGAHVRALAESLYLQIEQIYIEDSMIAARYLNGFSSDIQEVYFDVLTLLIIGLLRFIIENECTPHFCMTLLFAICCCWFK